VERLLAGPHQPACAEGWILGGLVGGLLALLALGLAALPVTHSLLEAFVSL
jgi:hypothetical protein